MDDIRLDMRGRLAPARERINSRGAPLPIIEPRHRGRGRLGQYLLRWTQPANGQRKAVRVARTILAVEDDPLNLRLFRDMLTWQGYETIEATNAAQALAAVDTCTPDLVLLDIQLPGLSGLDVVRHFKEDLRLRAVPIIAVTALALRSHEATIRASGVNDYVTKPFAISDLMEIVRRHLPPDGDAPLPDEGATDETADDLPPWSVSPGFSFDR